MGDPRKHRAKYSTPKKAWEKERIDEEKELIKEYYFKNKTEIWKLTSKLRNFARQAKKLIPHKDEQAEKEKLQLLTKLKSLGLISEAGVLDDVLGISPRDLFNRRLQSLVFNRGLAKTMKQARQFIVHEHILVDGKKVTSPNYLVPVKEEGTISFAINSPFIDDMHPERKQEEKLPKKPEAKGTKKEEKKEKAPKKEEKVEKKKESPKEKKKKEAPKTEEKKAE
jgi:small subunit ribosomal protein S4